MSLAYWTGNPPRDLEEAVARARAGAAYLDKKFGTRWDRDIDTGTLDIGSPCHCVLGQLGRQNYFMILFPGFARAVEFGFSLGVFTDLFALVHRTPAMVRGYDLLAEGWKAVLRERLGLDWKAERRVAGPGRRVGQETGVAV